MTYFGVMIQESLGWHNLYTMADDRFYDGFKEKSKKYGTNFVAGKKGIKDSDIDRIADAFAQVVKKLNNKERFDLKSVLETIVEKPDIAVQERLISE